MKNEKFHCPKCKLLYDSLNHLPRIIPTCNHTMCNFCINEIKKKFNKFICPIDNTIYEDTPSNATFKENTNLIEELQTFLKIPTNYNYEISNENIFFDKSGLISSDKLNDSINSFNLNFSMLSSSYCYYKKSKDLRTNLIEKNPLICKVHSLPLNIICINEKKKICSQCALNNEHSNHQIMTENEFMNNIDNLINIFQEVDNNQIKYLNFNCIDTKLTLDKIGKNIDNLINMINSTKEQIVNNINCQCEKVEKYLNERKQELYTKYQSTNFDISTLRESTLNWMQSATDKLDKLNEIKDPSSDCLKLLDDEKNKNLFNLITNGKQLNGRYNFIQETLKLIDKLESFDKNGIQIKPNKNIIDRIMFTDKECEEQDDIEINLNIDEIGKKNELKYKQETTKDNNIKTSLFQIKEDKELIHSLHLSQFRFEFIDNKAISDEQIEDKKDISNEEEVLSKKNNEEEIILNMNIDEGKEEKKENNEIDKDNISKIIDDLSFRDDTLLINPNNINQNEKIYRKKIKQDSNLGLKDNKKIENKTKDNEKNKTIYSKKIEFSDSSKNNNAITKSKPINKNKRSAKHSFNINNAHTKDLDQRSTGRDIDNNFNDISSDKSNNKNKNEIVINFSKPIMSRRVKPICSNYLDSSEEKNFFVKTNSILSPITISRSPGRMTFKNKMGIYSITQDEQRNNNKIYKHQSKNYNKSSTSNINLNYNKNKKILDRNSNETLGENSHLITEYTSYSNNYGKKPSAYVQKPSTRRKTITSFNLENSTSNNNSDKIIKKVSKSKMVNYTYDQKDFDLTNNNYDNKSKKELQELINNQIKNNSPNFSRINMNGYGIQYLCSLLHKKTKINFKEIKLVSCNITDDDLFILARTLLDHDIGILVLNLSSNQITDDSASNILDILKDCKTLKGLSLYNNKISNELKDKMKEYVKLGRENLESVQLYI